MLLPAMGWHEHCCHFYDAPFHLHSQAPAIMIKENLQSQKKASTAAPLDIEIVRLGRVLSAGLLAVVRIHASQS